MATRKLTPKCKDLYLALIQRAEQQLRVAHEIRKAQGKLHWYTATGSDGKQVQWRDCMSSHCTVIRIDESDRMVFHDKGESWLPLEFCDDVRSLCECADHQLNLVNNP